MLGSEWRQVKTSYTCGSGMKFRGIELVLTCEVTLNASNRERSGFRMQKAENSESGLETGKLS